LSDPAHSTRWPTEGTLADPALAITPFQVRMQTFRLALRRLPKPFLAAAALITAVLFLSQQSPQLAALQEPGELLSAGFAGVWAVQWGKPARTPVLVVAGLMAAVLVAALKLGLAVYLGIPLVAPPALSLARAAMAGLLGVWVATLLRQRFAL